MPTEPYTDDFFVSRRGSAAEVAQEVAGVLREAGYRVRVQDQDIAVSDSFIEKMHEMLDRCRHLIAILTKDYLESPYTKLEWTNFQALAAESNGTRRLIPLRVEDVKPSGLFAAKVYADLVGVTDHARRYAIILNAATGGARGSMQAPQIVRGLPPHNPAFIGRTKLLEELHRTLTAAKRPAAITQAAIHGLGGIGKTALAAQYAHQHLADYAGVWWASATSRAVLIESLAELCGVLEARRTGMPYASGRDSARPAEMAAREALVRISESAIPWLLVYDNVANPADIRDLVPTTGARILITSRWANWRGQAEPVEVDLLSAKEAVELLLKRTGRRRSKGARRLATALGYLPLALDHAGAYIVDTGMSFDGYAERAIEFIARAPVGNPYPDSVFATFSLAIGKAIADCAAAERLLAFLSMLAPEQIPRGLIDDTILGEDDRNDALASLHRVSLVKYERDELGADGSQAIFIHRLVRAAMHRRLKETDRIAGTVRAAVARLATAYPDKSYSDPGCWPRCMQLLPHTLQLREEAATARIETVELAGLLDGAANYLLGRSAYGEAEPLFKEAIAVARRKLGPEHEIVGQYLNNLGNLYLNSSRFEEAEPHYRKAISIGFKTLGRDSPRVATRLNNLAMVWQRQRRYRRAEAYFRISIKTSEKALGRNHFTVASRLHKLAGLLAETKRYAEAEPLFREAIAIGQAELGRDNFQVCNWGSELANLLRDTGRHAEAEPLYREELSHFGKSVGEMHSNVAFTRENYAELLLAMGRTDEALQEASRAVSIHEQLCGATHKWTQGATEVLIKVQFALGRASEAAQLRRRHGLDRTETRAS